MRTATNGKGERVYLNESNGKWEPLRTASNDAGERVAFNGNSWVPFDERTLMRKIEDKSVEYAQTAGAIGSGALAEIAAQGAGIISSGYGGNSYERSNELKNDVRESLTYEPSSGAAQQNLASIAEMLDNPVLNWLGSAGERFGDFTHESLPEGRLGDTLGQLAQVAPDVAATATGAGAIKLAGSGIKGASNAASGLLETAKRNATIAPALRASMDDDSVGSMKTGAARQAAETAESLPVPVRLTQGQATRDPLQFTREAELAKAAGGGRLLEFMQEQQRALGGNIDYLSDGIEGAAAVGDTAVDMGAAIKAQLQKSKSEARKETDALYQKAKDSNETDSLIDTSEISNAIKNLTENGNIKAGNPALLNKIVALAEGRGVLNPRASIKDMESFRADINQYTDFWNDGAARQPIIKAVDRALDSTSSAPAYRAARKQWAADKRQLEQNPLTRDVGSNRARSESPRTSDEGVLGRMERASLDDLKNFRQALERSEGGSGMWAAYQQKVLTSLKDKITAKNGTSVNHNALVKEVNKLDEAGKLDFLFGKEQAQQLRDIADVARGIGTQPFGSFVNNGNTASVGRRFGQFADVAGGSLGRLPGVRAALQYGGEQVETLMNRTAAAKSMDLKGLLQYEQ